MKAERSIVAGLAERLVRKSRQSDFAEQRADAVAIVGFLILAAVFLSVGLNAFGHFLGVVGFDLIVSHFHNSASGLAQPVFQSVLKLVGGFRRGGPKEKLLNEPFDFFVLRLGGGLYLLANSREIRSNRTYQKIDKRLGFSIEASFPGYVFASSFKLAYSRKRRLFL